jgi:hypothetical protein
MRDSVYAGSLRRFVKGTEGVAQRLEFADEFGGDRWPMSGDIVSLRRLLDDLRSAAVYRGRTGASDYRLAAQVVEQLTAVVEAHDAGDLARWRSCRGSVLASVATLRQLCQPEHDELVVRSAAPAAPAPRQAMPEAIVQEQHRGDEGHEGEKPAPDRKGRGRNKTPVEEGAPFRAAFWMHEATDLIPDDDSKLQSAFELLGTDPKPKKVFELLRRHGLTIMLSSVRNRVPLCWPKTSDGQHAPSWEFADYAAGLTADSFDRTLRRHKKEIRGTPDLDRHTPAARADLKASPHYTPPATHGPTPGEIRRRTIIGGVMAVEEALAAANDAARCGRADPDVWEALRKAMVDRMRLPADVVAQLLAGRNVETAERVALFLVETRRRAGDDGDCDPDGRPR